MTLQELKNQFPAAPEYLTQIFLIDRDNGTVPNARLADRLGVSRPAVSQAVGRLKKLGLVAQDRYGAIGLSPEGRLIAEKVVLRHFLLEHMLVNVLNFPWDKSDTEAGLLQDSLSDELTEHLAVFLGNPQTCPHGNPFPGSDIEQSYLEAPALSEAEPGAKLKIIRITEEGEMTDNMLLFCREKGLKPGKNLTVTTQNADETICKDENSSISIPLDFAAFIRWESV
ncbi:MAG: metal-dependent transcriptional regulator [Spirochaetaceae bacterium]|nr:metal-dependent transcriptional regulator [Spirochaetaceae bacterium]